MCQVHTPSVMILKFIWVVFCIVSLFFHCRVDFSWIYGQEYTQWIDFCRSPDKSRNHCMFLTLYQGGTRKNPWKTMVLNYPREDLMTPRRKYSCFCFIMIYRTVLNPRETHSNQPSGYITWFFKTAWGSMWILKKLFITSDIKLFKKVFMGITVVTNWSLYLESTKKTLI